MEPASKHQEIRIERLSQLGENDYPNAHCPVCYHSSKLDIGALLETRGDLTFKQIRGSGDSSPI